MTQTSSFKPIVEAGQQGLCDNPETRNITFGVESRQIEGLRSRTTIRDFTIEADEPEVLGGADSAPNPVEYVLAALATCQEITYRLYADALDIPLDNVSVNIEGDLDLAGFFAVDDSVRPGYQTIRGTVNLDSSAPREKLELLKQAVDAHCPVLDIISNPTPVTLTIATPARVASAAE